jgi:Ca2+/H+ antiporter
VRNGRRYVDRSHTHTSQYHQIFPSLTPCLIILSLPTQPQLAVVVSSLAQDNPSLALSNIYGSSIANILGSFSIGLLFAPASLEGIEVFSARIYTTLLVILYIGIAALALPPVRKHVGSRAGRMGLVRGRIIGGLLVGIFVIYVGAIAFGIYRGIVIAPEDSDSDSDDDESEDDTSDNEDVAPRAVIAPPVGKS